VTVDVICGYETIGINPLVTDEVLFIGTYEKSDTAGNTMTIDYPLKLPSILIRDLFTSDIDSICPIIQLRGLKSIPELTIPGG